MESELPFLAHLTHPLGFVATLSFISNLSACSALCSEVVVWRRLLTRVSKYIFWNEKKKRKWSLEIYHVTWDVFSMLERAEWSIGSGFLTHLFYRKLNLQMPFKILIKCTRCPWIIRCGEKRGFLLLCEFPRRRASARYSLSSLALEMMSLWTSSSPATKKQKPGDPFLPNVVSICSEPVNVKEHLAKQPSLGSRGAGAGMICCVSSWSSKAMAVPHWGKYSWPYASVKYLLCITGVLSPKTRQCLLTMSKCFLRSLPWGVRVRYSLSTVAGLSPLRCCHVMCAVASSFCFVVRRKVYSSQKLLLSVHRNQTLKLLWFPFVHLWASSFLRNLDS